MYGVGFGYGAIGATTILKSGGAAYSYLLDTYSGSSVAYSLRKLSSTYSGNCIRVRRSSDNAEQNIGFVSNVLDTASLLIFCGSGDGFVTTWYDQSGNGLDSTRTTASKQPRIVNSGVLNTYNSKPYVDFNQTNLQSLYNSSATLTTFSGNLTTFITARNRNTSVNQYGAIISQASETFVSTSRLCLNLQAYPSSDTVANIDYFAPSGTKGDIKSNNTFYLLTFNFQNYSTLKSNGNTKILTNNTNNTVTSFGSGTPANLVSGVKIGGSDTESNNFTAGYFNGDISEIISYPSHLTTISDINTNINTFYGIY